MPHPVHSSRTPARTDEPPAARAASVSRPTIQWGPPLGHGPDYDERVIPWSPIGTTLSEHERARQEWDDRRELIKNSIYLTAMLIVVLGVVVSGSLLWPGSIIDIFGIGLMRD